MNLKHFKREEFTCQVSGTNNMEQEFLEKLDVLREACGFPFEVTSGYRHPTLHPIERKKDVPGTHASRSSSNFSRNSCSMLLVPET